MTRDSGLGEGLRTTLSSLLRQLEFLEEEIGRLDDKLERLVCSPRYAAAVSALVKLQGVQLLTALVFLTEIGALGRFANRRQIGAYLGLVPRSYESGSRNDRKGHITRQGPSRVRRVLCQAAWSRIRSQGVDEGAYQRIVQRNPKHKKIAVVAAMRRLGVRMWHRALEAPPEAGWWAEGRRAADFAPAGG
jgi:transposase